MSPPPAPSGSSSSKRGPESSPCSENTKRRKVVLAEELAEKDSDFLPSQCKHIEEKLEDIALESHCSANHLRGAKEALESANKAFQDAQRLLSTAMKTVEAAEEAQSGIDNDVSDVWLDLINLRRSQSLQAAMAKRDRNKKDVEERESAIEKMQGDLEKSQEDLKKSQQDFESADHELYLSECAVDAEFDGLEVCDMEFMVEDEI
ncbi:uncharacterized protein B0J16DRAFT_322152 [Fusarium flagelliforme]|uniref:Uncharacterized protein n=1 Tax=Fusarium flagelliforme TaxID=2675880 RepID=A0A395MKN6_9HYPO|nr:uncharacterized protein B0J16DRAFT_322152 [Fusarium flagelliforme]KAH7183419.1 hypothetical protein B0J16DRAFT_322152 [Fusarium flagelliforme]RFN48486.1 hypothetical protein FIE12Z_7295 [Fusarium flagelliforme]